jgi:hypothetical protein
VIKRFLKSRWTYTTIRILGFVALASYLLFFEDWRFSILWALLFPAIAFFVAFLIVRLNLSGRFPKLNHYFLFPKSNQGAEIAFSDDEWTLRKAKYLDSGASILFAPSEEGLICVPILMAGLGLLSSTLGGAIFGLLHLGRFTYLECIGKSIYYTLVCLLVLPHGLLTVVMGHLILDFFALVGVRVVTNVLTRKLGER